MFAVLFALLYLLPIIIATDLSDRQESLDTSTHCGLWDSVTAGDYSLGLDQWGASDGEGHSCASLTSLSGTHIAWKTEWNWQGGYQVKSYPNIQLDKGLNQQLSAISSIPTVWSWTQEASGDVCLDIAYDLFTSDSPGGINRNEVMIWIADFSGPISYNYDSNGNALPITRNIDLAGYNWNLFEGSNGQNMVWTFLPADVVAISPFNADLKVFLEYLTESGHISSSEYLKVLQAGTEATSGSATLTTWDYSVAIY